MAEASARSECLGCIPQEKQLLSGSVPSAQGAVRTEKGCCWRGGLDPNYRYHMLADGTCYQDLGADHFARRDPARNAAKLAARIRNLGFNVEIRPEA